MTARAVVPFTSVEERSIASEVADKADNSRL